MPIPLLVLLLTCPEIVIAHFPKKLPKEHVLNFLSAVTEKAALEVHLSYSMDGTHTLPFSYVMLRLNVFKHILFE